MDRRKTVADIMAMKQNGEKIVMLTAYDYPSARIAEEAGVDMILVGDSLGMVVLGYDSTVPVTIDDMLHHSRAVARGSEKALIVTDLPFMTYQTSVEDAMRNAGRLLQEGNAQAVKLEGGVHMAETVRRLTQIGIPVMGHIGLTPQSVHAMGGFRVQGRETTAALALVDDAKALEHAGCFSIVVEGVPDKVAELITDSVDVPVIGIGAGRACDGQVLVLHDVLGLEDRVLPKFVRRYAELQRVGTEALKAFAADVRSGAFPSDAETYHLTAVQAEALGLYGRSPDAE